MTTPRMDPSERRFLLLFLPIAFGFGGRMSLVAFNGPLARMFTDNGYLIGLLLAVSPLVALLLNPMVGRLSDRTWTRWGRRIPFILVGVPTSTLIYFLIPSAPDYAALLILFLLRTLFMSVGGVPIMSLIPDMTSPQRRGLAMSLFMIAGGIGAIVIQISGKFFWESHFEWVFYLTGILGIIAIPPFFFIREPRPEAHELESARRRRGAAMPALWRALLRGEPIALFLASASLRYFGAGIAITYMTLFAMTDLGISVGDAALAAAAAGAFRLVLALPAGRVADRWNRKRVLLATTVLGAVVHTCTALAVWNLTGLYVVLLAGSVIGTLDMIVGGPLFMDLLPADQRGELTGANMLLQGLFRSAAALLGGAIFAWSAGYRLGYLAAAFAFVISAVFLSRVRLPTAHA